MIDAGVRADRIPPQSLEAEMAALGAAMIDGEARGVVVDLLRAGDFYAHVHETIFTAISALALADKPVDRISVAEYLRDRGQLVNVGGLAYLTSMMDTVPTAATAEYYAGLVREKAQLRALIRAGGEIVDAGFDGEIDVARALEKAESIFSHAVDRGAKGPGGTSIVKLVADHYWRLAAIARGEQKLAGLVTPWRGFTELVGHLFPGQIMLWVAGPGMGKTAVILTIADWTAAKYDGQTALFSLEMSAGEIAARTTAMYADVSVRYQNKTRLDDRQLEKIATRMAQISGRRLTVFDGDDVGSLADIRRELRLMARNGPIAAICVDGINFLSDVDNRANGQTKNDRMDVVYKTLKKFARDFGAVMYAAQHVNREGMVGRPSLKDVRDGGNAEGTCNFIVAPYRPKPLGSFEERAEGEFIVLKARDGEPGIVERMAFDGPRAIWYEQGARPWFEPQPSSEPEADLFTTEAF